jgi:hypothetical protein
MVDQVVLYGFESRTTIAGGRRLSSNGADGERETTPPPECAPATASTGTCIGMAWLPCTRVFTTSSGKVASHPTLGRGKESVKL